MRQLLRKVRICNINSIIRIVTYTTAGTVLLYSNSETDFKSFVSVSVSAPLRHCFSLRWPIAKELIHYPSIVTSDHSLYGNIQSPLSRIGSIPSEDVNKDASEKVRDGSKSIAAAAAMVGPAVVFISVPCRFHGKSSGSSSGSGTIIDRDGTILTCAHLVLSSRGKKVTSKGKVDVTLQDGRTYVGTVVNADLHSDIAIVKIKSSSPLPVAKLGSSCKLCPGDWVVAMGCPHSLRNTVTAGIVSCLDRKSSEMGIGGMLREYIQIDCAINPGNSGGPLVNLDGEVVGVNVMKLSAATGLNFAVPIDSIKKIMKQFRKNGRIVRPWLGLKMLDLNEMIIAQLKDKDATFPNVNKGVLVLMVSPGSPADLAGFHPGDVVIGFRGKPAGTITEINELMGERIGIPLKVVVKRAEDTVVTLTVVPEETNPEL